MKIKQISIKNFRSISDQIIVAKSYNVFVGPNGAGKSTILHALNLFFGEHKTFSESDFSNKDTSKPIEIAVTFESFDEESRKTFDHYIRHDQMTVVAEVKCVGENKFEFTRMGERLVNPDFADFFETPKTPAEGRKKVYAELQKNYTDLASLTSATAMESELRKYEESMPAEKKEVRRSTDDFFGISKGTDKLNQYVTWVYVPAVKDAVTESEEGKNTHLGRLIQYTVRSSMDYEAELLNIQTDAKTRYDKLLSDQQQHLTSLEDRLKSRLRASVTSGADIEIKWRSDDKSVSVSPPSAAVQLEDKGFKGEVQNFGHGLQRAFLLVILQELLGGDTGSKPTLLLGCEEPELYQHPPQARHLASVLRELSAGEAQVFLTTHSPYFVDIESIDGLRKITNRAGRTTIGSGELSKLTELYNACFEDDDRKIDAVRAKLSIQVQPRANEIFFSDFVILVEGISDRSCLETYLNLSGRNVDFNRIGSNIIEANGKSSLILLQLMMRQFQIPHYVMFDCDGNETEAGKRRKHEIDNLTAFRLAGSAIEEAFPVGGYRDDRVTAWETHIEDVMDHDFGALKDQAIQSGRKSAGHLKDCRKNPFFISGAMEYAWKNGCRFESIAATCDTILKVAHGLK